MKLNIQNTFFYTGNINLFLAEAVLRQKPALREYLIIVNHFVLWIDVIVILENILF